MQALKLDGHAFRLGHPAHSGQTMRIVRGELAVDERRGINQRLGADQIGEIGRRLGGMDRIILAAIDLCALDFGIPIGALDQPYHQPAAAVFSKGPQSGDHFGTTLLISLDGETQSLPFTQFRFVAQAIEDLQRERQPVGFLGVEREIDVGLRRLNGQSLDAGVEVPEHIGRLGGLVT